MMNIKSLLSIIFSLCFTFISAQEVITGLQFNEIVKHEHSALSTDKHLNNDQEKTYLHLPFFDDFATSNIYPDKNLWLDNYVFINSDFAFRPTNIGVATFDAVDDKGAIYPHADWVPFQADYLTSGYIRLDTVFDPVEKALNPSDSVYLSFFYQPQGIGEKPESWDTLVLELSRPTGDTIFAYYDSISVNIEYYLNYYEKDTLFSGDTLWSPPGCNPDLYVINYSTLTANDGFVSVICDSVMEAEYVWEKVWSTEGMSLQDFQNSTGKDFVQVMIPVKDSAFFTKNFQFRFKNYASIANDVLPTWRSNVDHWNIDYVYLNYERRNSDTTYRKLVFSERAPSFLKNYEVMPYRQYKADAPVNTLRPDIEMFISNLDDIGHNTKYSYSFQQLNGSYSIRYDGGSCNLPPFYSFGFQNCETGCGAAHACPPVYPFNLDFDIDTASYIIKHYISDSSETNILVDSTIYKQGFYNYYAYDDGTPEFGYGNDYSGAKVAYRFNLSVADTIFGVQMYFNKTLNNSNDISFDLLVFQDNNGKPGEIVVRKENLEPEWNNGLYEFYTYLFDDPKILSGTFYVGWEQFQAGSLNAGFDTHRNSSNNIFYTVDDNWYQSSTEGSLMIRPIIGSIGGEYVFGTDEIISSVSDIKIFPNPAHKSFKVDINNISQPESAILNIYNIYGSRVLSQIGVEGNIAISNLPKGIYIVKISDLGKIFSSKLIIN
ncbi:MAG: hypothetical protein C0598_01405 [Marinilabiliales bacterium]|nr:MAG: hypothetical protein C0598_01405 [Marinilabiliales bacterium]